MRQKILYNSFGTMSLCLILQKSAAWRKRLMLNLISLYICCLKTNHFRLF